MLVVGRPHAGARALQGGCVLVCGMLVHGVVPVRVLVLVVVCACVCVVICYALVVGHVHNVKL